MSSPVEVCDEGLWVRFDISNRLRKSDISVKNAKLEWGKFYKGSKSHEIESNEVDNLIIAPGSADSVSSSGRQGSWTGTEGVFDLVEGGQRICTIYWDCPWGKSDNSVKLRNYDAGASDYSVVLGSWNESGGAIGGVNVTIAKLA